MMYHWGFDGGGLFWIFPLLMFLIWVVIIGLGIWLAIRFLNRPAVGGSPGGTTANRLETPEEILARRLANGDIEPDDYERRLAALRSQPPKA